MSIFDSIYYKRTLGSSNEEPEWVGDDPDTLAVFVVVTDSEGKKKTFGRKICFTKEEIKEAAYTPSDVERLSHSILRVWCGDLGSVTKSIEHEFDKSKYFQNGRKWKE